MKRTTTLLAALAIVVAAAVAVPALTTTAGAADTSQVSVVHGIPGVPVDVYVDDALTLTDFEPEAVAGPLEVPAGDHRVEIYAASPTPPDRAPGSGALIDQTETVPAGKSVSLVAHLDESGDPALTAFVDDTSALAAGQARVTVRHTAAAPAVDVYVDGAKAVSDLSNPEEAVAEIPTGSHEIAVKVAGTDTTVIGPATLDFAANTNTIVYAIGSVRAENLGVVVQTVATSKPTPGDDEPSTTMPAAASTSPANPQAMPAVPTHAQPAYTG